jgi:pimeloyl-ACP methyl ester carboxylesterase
VYSSIHAALKYAGEVLQAGFHFCSFDFPGCGNSGGEYVTLGCNERWDVLRLIEQVRLRFGVANFFVWGRSMGAVAAIKFYQLLAQEQIAGRCQDIAVLGLVLDSAFISLKRMVVEVAQSRVTIPGLLVKAVFMMVSSSIEERAGFKVEQLELGADVESIRCSTLLVTSKEDSFVNYSHSEEIFSKLKLQDSKEIEYTRGEHY